MGKMTILKILLAGQIIASIILFVAMILLMRDITGLEHLIIGCY